MLCHKWASDGASLAGMCVKEMKTLVTGLTDCLDSEGFVLLAYLIFLGLVKTGKTKVVDDLSIIT